MTTLPPDALQALRDAVEALKHLRKYCECCGEDAVVKYDSQGEGAYWLCERTDGDHSDWCGIEIYRLPDLARLELVLEKYGKERNDGV